MLERSYWLDVLRAIAVFLVMCSHLIGAAGTPVLDLSREFGQITELQPLINGVKVGFISRIANFICHGFPLGPVGVCLFFLVTGFLIPRMLEKYNRTQFLLNRAFRIYPLLIVVTLLIYVIRVFILPCNQTLFIFFKNIALVFPNYDLMTAVLWTLPIEIYFYIICFFVGEIKNVKQIFFLQAGVALLLVFALLQHCDFVINALIFILYINLGSCFYFLFERYKESLIKSILLNIFPLAVFSASYAICSKYFTGDAAFLSYPYQAFLYCYAFFSTIYLLRRFITRLDILTKWLADCCYPLYLTHWFFGGVTMIILKRYINVNNTYFLLISALIVIGFITSILHTYLEKPAIRFVKRLNKYGFERSADIQTMPAEFING